MITQCKFSPRVISFENGFKQKWGVSSYKSYTDSCIFVGMYDQQDFDVIKNHKGFKVLLQTGTLDFKKNYEFIKRLAEDNNMFFIYSFFSGFPDNAKVKEIHLPIRDYSAFKIIPLGDKVYTYLGSPPQAKRWGYDLVEEVERKTGFEIIRGFIGHTMDFVKKEFYDKCFINLNLSISGCGGFTTAYELGYMGRYSITTSKADMPMFIRFNSVNDIVNIIDGESEKIGTIPEPIMNGYHISTDDWKQESFWI
jgi:hypothetical protein